MNNMAQPIPDRISEEELSPLISSILFERDYNTVNETLREYRKGELQKAIEAETDPKKKLELMVEKASKAGNFKKKRRPGEDRWTIFIS